MNQDSAVSYPRVDQEEIDQAKSNNDASREQIKMSETMLLNGKTPETQESLKEKIKKLKTYYLNQALLTSDGTPLGNLTSKYPAFATILFELDQLHSNPNTITSGERAYDETMEFAEEGTPPFTIQDEDPDLTIGAMAMGGRKRVRRRRTKRKSRRGKKGKRRNRTNKRQK